MYLKFIHLEDILLDCYPLLIFGKVLINHLNDNTFR